MMQKTHPSRSWVVEILERFQRQMPEPKIELKYINKFTLIIAVLLSAQSTDVSVNKVTKALFRVAYEPEHYAKMDLAKLKEYIKTIGLYNNKAKNIIALAKKLISDKQTDIPNNFQYLQSLPGIGRKSANVILCTLFGEKRIAVDTHVFRVSNRIGLVHARNVLEVEKQLLESIPQTFLPQAHLWLVLHGRYVCKARRPECENCIIKDLCNFKLGIK
ncbi:endonuclease III [Neorickettsia risticii]|uniref:Endonuclease III n=1 Tax=Neorickettsia risticii (strain Illinois) TaxID=434131 RepID=C6V4B2_NEORI|nr:endonuclease III [Neorickettsia risticii]ACT69229.1 endonuclease III [Neorickettsia risticii str. Illinois]